MALSAFSSLVTLIGLYPPTSDFNVIAGWAVIVFVLITYYKCKCGFVHYVKSFGDPVPLLAPLNVISEVATPLSMTFRHYGNVLSGVIIEMMIGSALGSHPPRLAAGSSRKIPAARDRYSRDSVGIFRHIQRMPPGVHLRYADHALRLRRFPGGRLGEAQG